MDFTTLKASYAYLENKNPNWRIEHNLTSKGDYPRDKLNHRANTISYVLTHLYAEAHNTYYSAAVEV